MSIAKCRVDQREGCEGKMSTGGRLHDLSEQSGSTILSTRNRMHARNLSREDEIGFRAKQLRQTQVLQGCGVLAEGGKGPGSHSVQGPAVRV